MPGSSPRALLVLVLATVVSLVGLVDATVSRTWDFAVVFALAVALQLILVLRSQTGRAGMTVRRDLAAWATEQAVATGETAERGGPYSDGAFPGAGQFGLVEVDDDGGAHVEVTLSGRTWDDDVLVSRTFRVAVPGPAGSR